ncbi:IS3 family transposase [Sulfuricurvum sp.]|uniref:IS3 family transposase n=1 Tax=Sulfuricurvum sp. TaxID=2025608 RepID=UPI00344F007A
MITKCVNHFSTIKELKNGIDEYIHKYDFQKFHSYIGYQKPMNVSLEYLKN